jgi:hypothetical protein
MALVNLQTDLTSLTFGHDRPGGGSSNQPYIQTEIPEDLPVQSPDFLLRNGFLAPVSAAKDTSRLTQMFFDFKSPNGLLFTAKENLLSRISVKTQASEGMSYAMGEINQGVYLPTSTIAQSLVGFTGTHLNLLGIDPTSPMAGVVQSGLFPGAGLVTYEAAIKGSANRLIELYDSKIKIVPQDNINILSYSGGPGSIAGVGKTRIKFASNQRTGVNSLQLSHLMRNMGPTGKDSPDGRNFTLPYFNNSLTSTRAYDNIPNINLDKSPPLRDFRVPLLTGITPPVSVTGEPMPSKEEYLKVSTVMSIAPSYRAGKKKTIDGPNGSRIHYTSPGQRGNIINYTDGKKDGTGNSMGPVDKINAQPIYRSKGPNKDLSIGDLVKFRIAAINDKNPHEKDYIHFRAYIDGFSDSYNGNWDAVNYMGRGESFYKYNSFQRNINLGFTVAAQSKEELIPMYKKLNYLASNLAPSYSDVGYMAGSLVTLTLGGWCYELPGFITAMTLDVPQESPWEIGINTEGDPDKKVKELPHIVKVSGFAFTPIERFRPSKQTLFKEEGKVYGDERYIALNNGDNNNYDGPKVRTIDISTSVPGGVKVENNTQ